MKTWTILLPPSTSTLEAAHILAMTGTAAEIVGDGWMRLTPRFPGQPEPSPEVLDRAMGRASAAARDAKLAIVPRGTYRAGGLS